MFDARFLLDMHYQSGKKKEQATFQGQAEAAPVDKKPHSPPSQSWHQEQEHLASEETHKPSPIITP